MLDDKAARSKMEPPTRGSSFFIENLLGSTFRETSREKREDTAGYDPGICPGLEATRPDEGLNWSQTSPNTPYCPSRSE